MAEYNPDHAAEDLLAIYSFTGGVAKYVQLLIDAGATTKTKMINHMRNMMIASFSPIPACTNFLLSKSIKVGNQRLVIRECRTCSA